MAEPVFSRKTLAFLRSLKRNNDREWFKAHKGDYEAHVREPVVRLMGRLEQDLAAFAPEFVAHPKVSLFRPYRDTRFSSDKTPIKTNAAAHFPARQLLKRGGGFYFEVTPDWVWIGGGIYMPEAGDLLRRVLVLVVLDLGPERRRVGDDIVLEVDRQVDETAGHGVFPIKAWSGR